jgi:hypothetical protein
VISVISKGRGQAPPPWVIWEALADPLRPGARQWLALRDDEAAPQVIDAEKPSLVVWSSLWPARPRDEIRFDIDADGPGSFLRWTLMTPDKPPDAEVNRQLRRRINYLINSELRDSFDQ